MGTIKDSHDMAPKEAKEIKKRWQEYTEELQKKKILMTQITQIMMVTHLEPDILECEIKWALGRITTNYCKIVLILQLVRLCSKSFKLGFSSM